MRKSTLLWLALATFCGIVLFHTSQKVHDEREKIATLTAAIGKEEESIRVLHTEWGYLNQPQRLEKLAKAYLKLAPLKGGQFAKLEDIPLRSTLPEAPIPKAEEQTVAKPDVAAAVEPPITIKILQSEAPVITPPQPPVATATAANSRGFGDVIKSLGVR